jgi:glycosyltransferase involved in cell wall biosynthesis
MKKICLVNNFNYGMYLPACLDSIEKQTLPFDAVIVVDDGSTDHSREIISSYCDRLAGWKSVFKSNGGQLSCFHAALPYVEDDDLVTLLDSDDIYPPDYLALLIERSKTIKADLYFCEEDRFNESSYEPLSSAALPGGTDFVIESSTALTRELRCWTGSPTSAIALKGFLYKALFPYPYEKDWVTRADDIIILGSGILNASKAYVGSLRISYRIHGNNAFYGKTFSEGYLLQREHKLDKLFGWYCAKQNIPAQPSLERAERELALIPDHLRKRFYLPSAIQNKEKKRSKKKRWYQRLSGRIHKTTS